jgi:hypothetical protein
MGAILAVGTVARACLGLITLLPSPSSRVLGANCSRDKSARSILSFSSYALSAVQDDNFQALQEGAVY